MLYIAAENGLKTVTENNPIIKEVASRGVTNCQTDSPAARIMTSSLLLVSRQNTMIAAIRTMNGRTVNSMLGSFNSPKARTLPNPNDGIDSFFKSSMTSNSKMMLPSVKPTAKNDIRNCLMIYLLMILGADITKNP